MIRRLGFLLLWAVASLPAAAQTIEITVGGAPDSPELAASVQKVARAALSRSPEAATEDTLLDRVILQLAAGDPGAALGSLERLRRVVKPADPGYAPVYAMTYELAARARLAQAAGGMSFEEALRKTFRDSFGPMDDLQSNHAAWYFGARPDRAKSDLQALLDGAAGKSPLDPGEAVRLAASYGTYVTLRDVLPVALPLLAEDEKRRYDIQEEARIPTRDGERLAAIVVRPRRAPRKTPGILFFTIYTQLGRRDAIEIASHGYVGVAAYPRGKHGGTGRILPYENEVKDTRDVIDWMSKQAWCDGQVGMYGGSYTGFAQWAAAKSGHPALKTIVPYVAAIPGQGLPMENNVFINANYGWAFYVGNGPEDDDKVYFDRNRWFSLMGKWYESGRPYREIDQVDGTPNPLLQRWLAHPSYDGYWQAMVPYGDDFKKIGIPVLTVTGYYDDGQISALRYFTEHTRRNPKARHYLLIGPYDHFGAQRQPRPVLNGYAIDPVAKIDTAYITFQWLDHVLRGGPMPEILSDRVNYEVMGANVWRHAPAIEKMHDELRTLYLDDHRLAAKKPAGPGALVQEVDLKDRSTSTNTSYYPAPIVRDSLDPSGGIVFVGEPFQEPVSVDGTLSGELRVRINKKDFDPGVQLYELTPEGKYFCLTYFMGRGSYASDMTRRRLLTPGKIETIPFERTRMVNKQLSPGSRLVVVVNVNKNSFAQVNYGTGKDVSDESIADAGAPLRVEWLGDSFVRIPIRWTAAPRGDGRAGGRP